MVVTRVSMVGLYVSILLLCWSILMLRQKLANTILLDQITILTSKASMTLSLILVASLQLSHELVFLYYVL
jgi:hypothetical protein